MLVSATRINTPDATNALSIEYRPHLYHIKGLSKQYYHFAKLSELTHFGRYPLLLYHIMLHAVDPQFMRDKRNVIYMILKRHELFHLPSFVFDFYTSVKKTVVLCRVLIAIDFHHVWPFWGLWVAQQGSRQRKIFLGVCIYVEISI